MDETQTTLPLVSVIIPAYNAEATIDRTLQSVCAQTYSALEILIVDDGSSDTTAQRVVGAARRDPRIQLFSQNNGGVARARNHGIAVAKGEFIAPIDADDLWHPEKIEKQMAAMLAAGADTGFVYCASRLIDADDRVVSSAPVYGVEGSALYRHLAVNFVGNGSAILARRQAMLACGGYDPSLRDRGLEGTEDYLLQLRLAARGRVATVPEYLVGYRQLPAAMSMNGQRMAAAYLAVVQQIALEFPEVPARVCRWSVGAFLVACAHREAKRRRLPQGTAILLHGLMRDPLGAGEAFGRIGWGIAARRYHHLRARFVRNEDANVEYNKTFSDYDTIEQFSHGYLALQSHRLRVLRALDATRDVPAPRADGADADGCMGVAC